MDVLKNNRMYIQEKMNSTEKYSYVRYKFKDFRDCIKGEEITIRGKHKDNKVSQ